MGIFPLIPAVASLILGVIYLAMGEGSPAVKFGGAIWFFTALWMQFSSPHIVIGVLMQAALAFTLEIWRRFGGQMRM